MYIEVVSLIDPRLVNILNMLCFFIHIYSDKNFHNRSSYVLDRVSIILQLTWYYSYC